MVETGFCCFGKKKKKKKEKKRKEKKNLVSKTANEKAHKIP
jgi:hypothetical protein